MGEMSEAEALTASRRAFPHDDIQRIGRGVRGADILQKVMHEGKEIGRIVYECKNVFTWQNEWLTRARSYRAEFQTQWWLSRDAASRAGKSGLLSNAAFLLSNCVLSSVCSSSDGDVEIGSLRLTTVGRQAKAAQMFEYVVGDHFVSRFNGIGEAVAALRAQHDRERQWHAETWAKEGRLCDEVESSRRDIAAQVRAIAEAPGGRDLRIVTGQP